MDFARVEAEFGRLKAQVERGALTEEAFKAQLEELMIEDEQGRWWILGYETGQWYVHDGEKWVQQEPPRAAPGPPAGRPSYPQATEWISDAQPRPAASAPSRRTLGQRLGRDGVSVLLITAGWLVVFLAGMLGFFLSWILAGIIGGIGGLITGLVLRRTEPPIPWKQVLVVTLGWIIGMAMSVILVPVGSGGIAGFIAGAIMGLLGGLGTAVALKWSHPFIQWKHVALVTLGWGIGWAVGGGIGWILLGGIGGAVGGWITFWQLREARQDAP